jgi:hypothetical protein
MRHYPLFQQDFGAPPPPPPPAGDSPVPPPPPPGSLQSEKSSSRAVWALILGIASWTICPTLIPAIIAWVLGKKEINEIEAGLSSPSGKTMAQIGMWLGIINVIISILVLILVIILFALGALGSMMNN